MKRWVTALLLTAAISSCKKENSNLQHDAALSGTWKYQGHYLSPITGWTNDDSTGAISFTAPDKCVIVAYNKQYAGSYYTEYKGGPDIDAIPQLYLSNYLGSKSDLAYYIQQDTLILVPGGDMVGAGSYRYVRVAGQ